MLERLPTPLRAQLDGLPRPFWWIWLGTLVNRAGTFIEPFFVLYLTGPRHVSVQTAGLVLTVWGVGSTLSQPLGGYLTDRYGRRTTLGLSLAATSVLLVVLGSVRGLGVITAAAFVLGLVADIYRPASSAAISDLVPDPDRLRAYALQFWAVNLGFSVASTSAGVLLHVVGFGPLFLIDAATTLAFGLLALRYVPETKPHSDDAPARPGDSFRLLRADRLLAAASGLVFVYAVLYAQANIALPLAVRDAGLSPSVYGYAIAVNGVLIVVGQPLTIAWLGRASRARTLPAGMALVGLGLAATGLCTAAWQFGLTVVVWTVGEILTAGSFAAIIAQLAPPHMRGRYAGALGLAWGGSALAGPLVGTSTYARSPTALWVSCAFAGVAAGLGQRWVLLQLARRPQSAEAAVPAVA